MREVYIGKSVMDADGKEIDIAYEQIDVDDSSNISYEYTSPIFGDISSIKCSKTTTYKVPATIRNLRVFELVNQPDARSNIPHVNMYFKEYRDGLPIIGNGQCRILEASEKDISLAVAWGNKVNIQKLSDIKLSDLTFTEGVINSTSSANGTTDYLLSDSDKPYGYLYIDFGMGHNNKYVKPSIRTDFILEKLEKELNLSFDKNKNWDIFKNYWIPLANDNEMTPYEVVCSMELQRKHLNYLAGVVTSDRHNIAVTDPMLGTVQYIKTGKYDTGIKYFIKFVIPKNAMIDSAYIPQKATLTYRKLYVDQPLEIVQEFDFTQNSNPAIDDPNEYHCFVQLQNAEYRNITTKEGEGIVIELKLYDKNNNELHYDYGKVTGCEETFKFSIAQDREHKEHFYLDNPLPDMTGADYLKSLLHMFGLFAFYDINNPNTIQLISINDIYDKIKNGEAKDWTKKRISESVNIEHTFKSYARKNHAKYAEDDTTNVDANGYVTVDAAFLDEEKELFTLKFAPTAGKDTAYIPLYEIEETDNEDETDNEPKTNTIKPRIVREGKTPSDLGNLKRGIFDETLYFQGDDGLLAVYYDTYQKVVKRPVVIETSVYLSAMDLHNLSEIDVIYLDGNYYMPISIQCDSQGNAKCKLLMLPEVHQE